LLKSLNFIPKEGKKRVEIPFFSTFGRVVESRGTHELKEELVASNDIFDPKKGYSRSK
jgi:hypothetical protein